MRIAIVNDTLMSVIALKRIIEAGEQHSIAWVAHNGEEAVQACAKDTPDLILMDIIMPVMDGVAATQAIMQNSPCAILLVTSSIDSNTSKVFEAMGAGALDAINTPVLENADGEEQDDGLLHKIAMIGKLISHHDINHENRAVVSANRKFGQVTPLIAIGSSTGGPSALVEVLSNIPDDFPAAFIIVQHVDKQFIDGFISWLNDQFLLPVRKARSGDVVEAGTVLISDSKIHLALNEKQELSYTKEPEHYPYIPSVNVFFESVARHWKGDAMGILLTGMGRDGANGLLQMKSRGFPTIAQEEASCAVYGMPKAAVDLNAADFILTPIEINAKIVHSFTDTNIASKINNKMDI